jgi:hypothetical protein
MAGATFCTGGVAILVQPGFLMGSSLVPCIEEASPGCGVARVNERCFGSSFCIDEATPCRGATWVNDLCFRPRFCTGDAILGRVAT